MVKTGRFHRGDTINYNGQNAVVVRNPIYSKMITIRVDGKEISVDRNDLFGMNDMKKYYDDKLAACDERIERNWKTIKQSEKEYSFGSELIKKCKNDMAKILADFNVKSVDEITDVSKRKEYLTLSDRKAFGKTLKNRASSSIMSAAIDTGCVCSEKMNYINQQALIEHFA